MLESIYIVTDIGTDKIWYDYDKDGQRIMKRFLDWQIVECDSGGIPPIPRGMRGPSQENCTESSLNVSHYVRAMGKTLMKCFGDWNSTGSIDTVKYIFAGDERIALVDNDENIFYYLKDHLGNTRVMVKETPAAVDTIYATYPEYYAYGASATTAQSLGQNYLFTGKEKDGEDNLNHYYFGARYYNAMGRWMAVDPLHGKYPNWSPYAYCKNNPMKYIDRFGLEGITIHELWHEIESFAGPLVVAGAATFGGAVVFTGGSILGGASIILIPETYGISFVGVIPASACIGVGGLLFAEGINIYIIHYNNLTDSELKSLHDLYPDLFPDYPKSEDDKKNKKPSDNTSETNGKNESNQNGGEGNSQGTKSSSDEDEEDTKAIIYRTPKSFEKYDVLNSDI